jgi:hypothetical protein
MTTADDPALELGGNFTIEQAGYFDTSAGASKDTLYKQAAITIGTNDASGNVYARIEDETLQVQQINNNAVEACWGVNWVAQTFTTPAEFRVSSTTVWMTKIGAPAGNITVSIRATAAGVPTGPDLVSTSLVANDVTGAVIFNFDEVETLANATVYAIVVRVPDGTAANRQDISVENTNPYASGQEATSGDSGSTWAGVGANDVKFTLYSGPIVESAATSGEYTVQLTADGVDLKLYVDGTEEDSVAWAGTVPDNANNWTFAESAAMPYMEYHRITVGGTLQQYVYWEYDTTFTDQSGNSHDATPSFAIDSSDADITATLMNYQPVEEAQAPGYSISDAPDFITTAPNLTSNFSSTIAPTIPGADVITDAAASSGTPAQLPWVMIAGFVILASSMTVTYVIQKSGSGSSVLLKMAVIGGLMGASIAIGVFDFWMLLFFLLPAIAVGLASRPQETLG